MYSKVASTNMSCLEAHTLLYLIDVHARLLILIKNFPLHSLILVCMFIGFEKKFPPAHLFHPMWTALFWSACLLILREISPCTALFCSARLMFYENFPTCTFNSSYTSTDVYLVHQSTGFFRMLMKGNFDPYVIWPLEKQFALLILWGLYVAKYDIKIMMIVKYSYVSIFSCLDWKLQNWNKVLFVCMTVCSFFARQKKMQQDWIHKNFQDCV